MGPGGTHASNNDAGVRKKQEESVTEKLGDRRWEVGSGPREKCRCRGKLDRCDNFNGFHGNFGGKQKRGANDYRGQSGPGAKEGEQGTKKDHQETAES